MKKVILINGSPRKKGTSYSFARTLEMIAKSMNHEAEIIHVYDYINHKKSVDDLKVILSDTDIVGLIAPLYVDALPYPVIWFLERLLQQCSMELTGKGIFAIGQCGFPDITRCDPILDTCRHFAEELKMDWLGGLGYGTGPMINGANLETLGKRGQAIINGFEIALKEMLEGNTIPKEVQDKITFKIPRIIYRPMCLYLNNLAKKETIRRGVDIRHKPYQ